MGFTVREIQESDFSRGFFESLENLREVGELKGDMRRAKETLRKIKYQGTHIFVAEQGGEIIGAITLLVEQKFLRNGAKAGHIEDVSTRKGHEGIGVGSALVQKALEKAKDEGCYKVVLDCSEANVAFYEKNGFRRNEVAMKRAF
ncbi:MAG: GNAT family N-acetyltransferase [Candidatus Aenigmarchaeota archaeon]|nr:GNAT family N-acetyltransferase [Candidatus Aenigmarchaeota archaeon]